jgi:hypothetical protein
VPGKRKIVLDIETGGLGIGSPVIEVAVMDLGTDLTPSDVRTLVFPHDPRAVQPEAASVNGYYERSLFDPSCWADEWTIARFFDDLYGATVVGCNPAFDTAHLSAVASSFKAKAAWHYRMIDIESMAYGLLDLDDVPGLITIHEYLTNMGFEIPLPDHTAAGDVTATWACYRALLDLRVETTGRAA